MIISCIVAMDKNRVIGIDNKLPWHLPADLKRFKDLTMGHPVIMGKNTYESILKSLGTPLPGRINIVLTTQKDYKYSGCSVVHNLPEALALARKSKDTEAFIIGGEKLYSQAINQFNKLYITQIETEVRGDAYFPRIDLNQWQILEEEKHKADKENQYPYTYLILVRKA